MSEGNGGVTIPGWAWKVGVPTLGVFQLLFGVLFTIGINLMMNANSEIQGMHMEVTRLNVQMEQAIRTEQKFETLRDQVNTLSARVARLEGREEERQ